MSGDIWIPPNVKKQKRKPGEKWTCLWQDERGYYVAATDTQGSILYLSAESLTKGDKTVEDRMRSAAISYGAKGGQPVWIEARKVSNMEWEDQMDRYLDGKIPDPIVEYQEAVENALEEKDGRAADGGFTGKSRD